MNIQTFKKIVTHVEAVMFEGGHAQAMEMCKWIGGGSSYLPKTNEDPREYLQVPTMFGPRDAKVGDYAVKIEENTFLVMKKEVLYAEYALVEDSDHPLVAHARHELGMFPNEDPDFKESLVSAIKGFVTYRGHSGSSSEIAIHMLKALLDGDNLLPLTDDPDEWVRHGAEEYGMAETLWQNKRNSKAISKDEGKTYFLSNDKKEPLTMYDSLSKDFAPKIDPNDLESA